MIFTKNTYFCKLNSKSQKTYRCLYRSFTVVMISVLLLSFLETPALTIAADSTLTPQSFGASIFGSSVAVGDLNGDGELDIVTGNLGQPGLIYLNNGRGNFTEAQALGLPNNVLSRVAVGDLNGDDALDIVTCFTAINGAAPRPSELYLNDGTGQFLFAGSFGGTTDVNAVALGDLNGDSALDIIIGAFGQPSFIYFNNGAGIFTNAKQYSNLLNVSSVKAADFNNDGAVDLFVGAFGTTKAIYFNDGTGNFQNTLSFGVISNVSSAVAGDFNGDGTIDIGIGNTNQLSEVYFNDGTGRFVNSSSFGELSNILSMAVADLNGDGALDIIIGSPTTSFAGFQTSSFYLNDGAGNFTLGQRFGSILTTGVSVGDMNNDGIIDIVVSNLGQLSTVYFNKAVNYFPASRSLGNIANTRGISVGDFNGDKALDIVAVNNDQPSLIYLNDGSGNFSTGRAFSEVANTTSVAVGDLNGDRSLDIVLGNSGQPSTVYLNDGLGDFTTAQSLGSPMNTLGIALGDFNNDGALDIVAGNSGEPSVVYLNSGSGAFPTMRPLNNAGYTDAVAVGDVNDDGVLDIVLGNFSPISVNPQPASVYLGDGTGGFLAKQSLDIPSRISSIALGDVNGDNALDLVATNFSQPLTIYLNNGLGRFTTAYYVDDISFSSAVALGDLNGDGALDIAVGNSGLPSRVYLNDGFGNFSISQSFGNSVLVNGVAMGDFNNDGRLDMVLGAATNPQFNNVPSQLYLNRSVNVARLPNAEPLVSVIRPGYTQNANFYSTPNALEDQIIPINYTLADREGDTIHSINAFYSINGGGSWQTAVSTNTVTTNLATAPIGKPYVFNWDTFASGFFGQSDNVVFRIIAIPGVRPTPNGVPGPYQRPYASATTFPFRVRGTQVRVTENNSPVANALVYRLPQGQTGKLEPIAPNSEAAPYTTDGQGFLRGRGQLAPGDQLIALRPVSVTGALSDSYTLYHTNIKPTATGVSGFLVAAPGVQQIDVSAARPLALFPLDISLEWDARNDQRFMAQLESDLERASEFLFDATNGQAALGEVRIFHDKQWWDAVNLRIYASNRVRPNADVGGVPTQPITDEVSLRADEPVVPPVVYGPGQLRMGAVWNRFGNASASLSEDWPRTLAHELGHYLLFLDDNYIGTDDQKQIVSVDTCPGLMSDPYGSNIELHPDTGWLADCKQTLSNRSTGRSDWATVRAFYSSLIAPNVSVGDSSIAGPATLPLAVTKINSYAPVTPTTALDVPFFYLTHNSQRYQPGLSARGYLFSNRQASPSQLPDRITPLGRPNLDQILARGARPGDRVCLYELDKQLAGCTTVSPGREQIVLTTMPAWAPDVMITPVTSTTLALRVSNLSPDAQALGLSAQLFPTNGEQPATTPIVLSAAEGGAYTGLITLAEPVDEAHIHVWVNEPDNGARREVVTTLAIGGNPGFVRTGGGFVRTGGGFVRTGGGFVRTGGGFVRTGGGFVRTGGAPVSSAEGDVLLVGDNLTFEVGQFLALQTTTSLPQPPPWATVVGNAYRFTTSPNAPDLTNTSLSFRYLESDVPPGEEDGIQAYFWNGTTWRRLETTKDAYYNIVSVSNQGPGLYALMASVRVNLSAPGWNLVSYPVHATQDVATSLASINGFYTAVYGYDMANAADRWKIYDVDAPEWVNDLHTLEYGKGYWINATEAISLYLKGGLANAPATASTAGASLPTPPATYYGAVPNVSPQTTLTVQARIDGVVCGQAQTEPHPLDGVLRNTFAINVRTAAIGGDEACGSPGRAITLVFLDGEREVWSIKTVWDNSRAIRLRPTTLYLPLSTRPAPSGADLRVVSVEVLPAAPQAAQPAEVRVTIRNAGATDSTAPFWVDLYVDPRVAPQVNQLWPSLSDFGASWRIYGLRAGETRTLSTRTPNDPLDPGKNYSNFAGFATSGDHQLYALVDSYADSSIGGAIVESDEQNNLMGPMLVRVGGGGQARTTTAPPRLDTRPR